MRGYLISIVAVSVFCGVVDILSPQNDMRKYLRLLCGICVLCIITEPLTSVFKNFGGLLEGLAETDIEISQTDYTKIFEDNLRRGAADEVARCVKDRISVKMNISDDKFDVSVVLDEKEGSYGAIRATVRIFPSGLALDAKQIADMVGNILDCPCTVIYE